MNPQQLRDLLHESLDAAFAASIDAALSGRGETPSLPHEITTRAATQRYVERAVRVLLQQDFGARW